ncbi:MAG: glycosyltransferase [Promicromonosporaceae bacterium]|nr:glycosyltransferase [Promicromonosporaceae bacterium]
MTDGVVLAHDYATQRGGAERVALVLARTFPGSPMHTTLYDPAGTFPEFADVDLRPTSLDAVGPLRRHHRAALPFLARAVDGARVEGDVLVASSTGWAHGFRGAARTVVYCHAPARWLYQTERYLGSHSAGRGLSARARAGATRAALAAVAPGLRGWDARAAARADVYLVNSTVTQRAVRAAYGIEAEVLAPPPALLPADGDDSPVPGLEPGFLLCVARLLPYKNVDVVVEAAGLLGKQLLVIGDGPDMARLRSVADARARGLVTLAGRVDDATLRWAYRNASVLVAASFEDYGLTPLEAGAFGLPVAVLGDGGYLDTVVDGLNGVYFAGSAEDGTPRPVEVSLAVDAALLRDWDRDAIREHVARFSEERFGQRLRAVVDVQLAAARGGAGVLEGVR